MALEAFKWMALLGDILVRAVPKYELLSTMLAVSE